MLAWLRERLPVRRFGPIAAAIACPPQLVAFRGAGAFAVDVAIAWLLLAQFRLWDDLVDRERDRERHPHRVLARTSRVKAYVLLCVALAIGNALVLGSRESARLALSLFVALTALLAAAYTRPYRTPATDLIRLAKYPVFVLLIAAGHPEGYGAAAYAAAIAAFVVAVAYEVWHDADTPLRVSVRRSS